MGRERTDKRSGRWGKWLAALVVLLLVAGGAAWQTGWAQEWYDDLLGDDELPADPAAVAAPPEVEVEAVVRPPALAQPADGAATLDQAALTRALAQLNDRDLGKHVIAAVGPLEPGGPEGAQVAAGDRAVHDALGDQRDAQAAHHREQGGGHREHDGRAHGLEVRPQPAQCRGCGSTVFRHESPSGPP